MTGPKVALINGDTSSDGDVFAYNFRQWKIGKLIGKRIWGGIVGITTALIPTSRSIKIRSKWPKAMIRSWNEEVFELMKMLPSHPVGLPRCAAPPVKAPAQ